MILIYKEIPKKLTAFLRAADIDGEKTSGTMFVLFVIYIYKSLLFKCFHNYKIKATDTWQPYVYTYNYKLFDYVILLTFFIVTLWSYSNQPILVIKTSQTNEVLFIHDIKSGDKLYFSWVHSLENTPWNEYFYISQNLTLILTSISFPSFAAGTPPSRGSNVRIQDGLIFMYNIYEEFYQITWLNSHIFVGDILVNGVVVTSGNSLPEKQLTLSILRRGEYVY